MYLTPAGQWMSMHIPEGWFGRKMETEKESEMTGMWMWKRRFELLPFTRKRCHSEWLHCCLRKMKLCRGLDSGNTNTDSNGKTEITNPRMRGTRAEGIPKVTKQRVHENFTSQPKNPSIISLRGHLISLGVDLEHLLKSILLKLSPANLISWMERWCQEKGSSDEIQSQVIRWNAASKQSEGG